MKTEICQETFNRICIRLRQADTLDEGTDMPALYRSMTARPETELTTALLEVLDGLFTAALGMKVKEDDYDPLPQAAQLMGWFQKLLPMVVPDPQRMRDEYLEAIRPYVEKGMLEEVFWSGDYSVLRFCGNLFGLFDYGQSAGRFAGIPYEEDLLYRRLHDYVRYEPEFQACKALEEAGMLFPAIEVDEAFGRGRPGELPNYFDKDTVSGYVLRTEADRVGRENLTSVFRRYSGVNFGAIVKALVFYSMRDSMRSAVRKYYGGKNQDLDRRPTHRIVILNRYLEIRIRNVTKTAAAPEELIGICGPTQSDGARLRELNEELHREEFARAEQQREREEKQKRIDDYWQAHPEEKEALDREEAECRRALEELTDRLKPFHQAVREVDEADLRGVTGELDLLWDEIREKENAIWGISFLRFRKRKACREEIDRLKEKRRALTEEVREQEAQLKTLKETRIRELKEQYGPLLEHEAKNEQRLKEIAEERIRDRLPEGS